MVRLAVRRGVGDSADLVPVVRINSRRGTFWPGVSRGVFFSDGERQLLMPMFADTMTPVAPGYNRFTLSTPASSPILAWCRRAISNNQLAEHFVPVYCANAFRYSPSLQVASDGLYEAVLDDILPLRVYGLDGQSMVMVSSRDGVGGYRYHYDRSSRLLVAATPVLIDGIRSQPTLRMQEKVVLEHHAKDGYTLAYSSLSADPPSCVAIVADGRAVTPVQVDGRQWRFEPALPGATAVLIYYVPNSFCLYRDFLEVYRAGGSCIVKVMYAHTDARYLFGDEYSLVWHLKDDRLMYVSSADAGWSTALAALGRYVDGVKLLTEQVSDCGATCRVVTAAVLDQYGSPAHGVTVSVSPTTRFEPPHNQTSNLWGESYFMASPPGPSGSATVQATVSGPSGPITATATLMGDYLDAPTQDVQPIIRAYRMVTGQEQDELVVVVTRHDGSPLLAEEALPGTVRLTAVGASALFDGYGRPRSEVEFEVSDQGTYEYRVRCSKERVTLFVEVNVPAQTFPGIAYPSVLGRRLFVL